MSAEDQQRCSACQENLARMEEAHKKLRDMYLKAIQMEVNWHS